MSLSGYEELAVDGDGDTGYTESQEYEDTYATQQGERTPHAEDGQETFSREGESILEDADLSGSTPRPPRMQSNAISNSKFADYPSPYEAIKRRMNAEQGISNDEAASELPATPGKQQMLPDMSMTPMSSPFEPTTRLQPIADTPGRKAKDPLLHRVLDRNYRVQATPLTARGDKVKEPTTSARPAWQGDSSPMSSPPSMAPQLRSEIYNSPVRRRYSGPPAPRTPGISVQTPAKGKTKDYGYDDEITWESDDEDADDVYKELGMSPPKTIQFAMAPSRLLQTPGMTQPA